MSDIALRILMSMSGNSIVSQAAKSLARDLMGMNPVLGGIAVAGLAVGAAIVAIGVKATQMAGDYDQAMRMVQSLTGASDAQMRQYDAGLKALAVDAGVAPTALAQGLYQIISSGASGARAMQELTLATEDSKIGMTDSKTTAEALTHVLANFTWQTKDANLVNGEMLETVTLGQSTFQQYASNITKAATTSQQFHISLETMSATWATMTANGISAGKASTDYVQLVQAMDGKIQTITKSLHKNGIAFNETKFNAADFGTKVQMLNQVMEEAAKKHVAITGVTLQAAQAITVISGHMGVYNSDLAKLSNHQTMAQKTSQAWAITQGGFNQQLSRAKAALDVVLITIGQQLLPIFTRVIQTLVPIIAHFGEWLVKSGALTAIINGVVGAVRFVIGAVGTFIGILSGLEHWLTQTRAGLAVLYVAFNILAMLLAGAAVDAVVGLVAAIPGLLMGLAAWAIETWVVAAANLAAFWPIYAVVGAIIAIIALVVLAVKHWGQIADWLRGVWSAISGFFVGLWNHIVGVFRAAWSVIVAIFTPIVNVFSAIFHIILFIIEVVIGVVILYIELWVNIIKTVFTPVIHFFQWIWNGITRIFAPVVAFYGALFRAAWNAIVVVWSAVVSFFTGVWQGITAIWGVVSGWFGTQFGLVGAAIKAVFSPILSWFGSIFAGLVSTIQGALKKIGDAFSGLGTFVHGVWDGIVNAIKAAINFIIDLINKIIGSVDKIHINTPFGSIGFSIPLIPKLASGGQITSSGLFTVGENGSENVLLPGGATVFPHGAFSGGGGGGQPVFITNIYAGLMTDRRQMSQLATIVGVEVARTWRSQANIQQATSGSVRS